MRIVVSGTHASGKSTLISDFVLRHPEYRVLPDPFELIDEAWDAPAAGMFAAQLRVSAERLLADDLPADVIAERGPLDFLAYLQAIDDTRGLPAGVGERAVLSTAQALGRVDLLVVLPLEPSDPVEVGSDEHPELRAAMDGALLELLDDGDVIGPQTRVVELSGTPGARLRALEAAVAAG